MKKMISLLAFLAAYYSSFSQETLQTVTTAGNTFNRELISTHGGIARRLTIYSDAFGFGAAGQESGITYLSATTNDRVSLGHMNSQGVFSEKLCALFNGNVGIGTGAPTRKLEIISGTGIGPLRVQGPNGSLLIDNVGSGENYYAASAGHFFQSSGTADPLMVIRPSGNIGIGTTSPAYKLDVNGGTRSVAFLSTADYNNAGFQMRNNSGVLRWGLGGASPEEDGNKGYDFSVFRYDNTGNYVSADLVIKRNTGNIGLGTFNPGNYKLAVEGTIGTRKIKVTQETWADYVFDSSYQLPSLTHVESFIKENKHLPEVPSAAEVKKDGLDLGDNQVLLLKKIEELTLYIIRQNKKMEQMEKQMAELQAGLQNTNNH